MLEKKMLNLIVVILLVSMLSVISLFTFDSSFTSVANLSSQFLIAGIEKLKFDTIQCPYC